MNELEVLNAVETSPVGLHLDARITYDEWEAIGKALQHVQSAIQWWYGDFLQIGEQRFGEMAAQFQSDLDMSYGSIANWSWVSGKVAFERRRESLSYSHHVAVAPLDPDAQNYWLGRAVMEKLTVRDLRDLMKGGREREIMKTVCTVRDLEEWLKRLEPDITIQARIEIMDGG